MFYLPPVIERPSERNLHSVPAVLVQVRDIGYAIPGIQIFCNNPRHGDCCIELARALKNGGRVVPGTYWFGRYNGGGLAPCVIMADDDRIEARPVSETIGTVTQHRLWLGDEYSGENPTGQILSTFERKE